MSFYEVKESLFQVIVIVVLLAVPATACCPVSSGQPVINADQTVILLWDPATKTQHFIRQASFKSEAADFGFLVPSPTQPVLDESGNEAFSQLRKLTEPEKIKKPRPSRWSCSDAARAPTVKAADVQVLEQKLVAGFDAAVLEATSAEALAKWLRDHGYAFSPEVEAWAKPYVDQGWKITALKVAKNPEAKGKSDLTASALRMSFQTERPLFPYREPDSQVAAKAFNAKNRLLRIYFVSDGRYEGSLTPETPWTGKAVWAGKLSSEDRKQLLSTLRLPESTGPVNYFMTEFEDYWPYRKAPADVMFAKTIDRNEFKRPPIIEYVAAPFPTDATSYAVVGVIALPPLLRRLRRKTTA
jgi:hypothetical protein